MKKEEKLVDIDAIYKEKKPIAHKFTPKILVRKLEKKIHQKELNEYLRTSTKEGQAALCDIIDYFDLEIKVAGLENIPKNDRYVFVANHPLGLLDGIGFLNIVHHYFGEVKSISNDLLLKIESIKSLFLAVNVYGKFNKQQILNMNNLYESDKQILIFPAGLVSRRIKGKYIDLPWKKSFLTKAIQSKRNIIPVYIDARNSNFFYNFARTRKLVGIKFNVELLLLLDEAFKFTGKQIIYKFGEPISYKKFTKNKDINHWVEYVRQKTYELKDKKFDNISDFEATAETKIENK